MNQWFLVCSGLGWWCLEVHVSSDSVGWGKGCRGSKQKSTYQTSCSGRAVLCPRRRKQLYHDWWWWGIQPDFVLHFQTKYHCISYQCHHLSGDYSAFPWPFLIFCSRYCILVAPEQDRHSAWSCGPRGMVINCWHGIFLPVVANQDTSYRAGRMDL